MGCSKVLMSLALCLRRGGLVSWALENGARPDDPMLTDPYRCPPLLDTVARRGSVVSFKLPQSKGARRGLRTLHSAVDTAFDVSESRIEMVRNLVDDLNLIVNALDGPEESQTAGVLHSVRQQGGQAAAMRMSFASCWKRELTREYEGLFIAVQQS
ncbi:uncharacterized protein M437DRAFT_68116 [Aureobasidium melanogenum CBS 110374]|uniref:Prion-inhibition and propagation HeLo domain-containing protein n=1 Tax=Aureobasidium melanogenum (strain CBS 110374) TaxID=1043003 RepID=A0A074VN92_AURM1|nr:uncharacterized protein M437DRAFT_68116 [Aureobasidium melanogenum CBS 110374]KEQ60579.1 hypothetical protein M437DRAFT_68116 [Aureobasidium melanogenum CBS 110374]